MNMNPNVPANATLLLVEDDDLDVMAVQRALKAARIDNPLVIAHDGMEAIEILKGQHADRKIDGPVMILLDLNMPRMNGIDFLRTIRGDENLHDSVVFVLTTSDARMDIDQAYAQNIAGYLVKGRNGTEEAVQLFDIYRRSIEMPGSPRKTDERAS